MIYVLLDLCSDSRFLRILFLFKLITRIICIVVPILLIVTLMIDLLKGIINSDDSKINEIKKKGLTRIITAIVVFLVPTFVSFFLNIINFGEYDNCIKNVSIESIK